MIGTTHEPVLDFAGERLDARTWVMREKYLEMMLAQVEDERDHLREMLRLALASNTDKEPS